MPKRKLDPNRIDEFREMYGPCYGLKTEDGTNMRYMWEEKYLIPA